MATHFGAGGGTATGTGVMPGAKADEKDGDDDDSQAFRIYVMTVLLFVDGGERDVVYSRDNGRLWERRLLRSERYSSREYA